ncbi:hypothetical protein SLA2020_228630 [Shorea laevis]
MAAHAVSSNSLYSSSSISSAGNLMAVYGSISIQGVSPNMNDRLFVKEYFCRPVIFSGMPLHFFAVYDGRDSSHVSSLCKNLMHMIVAEELMHTEHLESMTRGVSGGDGSSSSIAQGTCQQVANEKIWEDKIRRALRNSFERMDLALGTCSCDGASHICRCRPMVYNFLGSTANVAILSLHHIIVANCGHSRAVLCRAGKAVLLSSDHKPNRPDELERIYAAGGWLINRDGLLVNGILDITRAIGDNLLKGIIISEPEITITKREFKDEFLILASDGLWNVLSNAQACQIVSSAKAASILSRLALARGSEDNISIIVVDLSRH